MKSKIGMIFGMLGVLFAAPLAASAAIAAGTWTTMDPLGTDDIIYGVGGTGSGVVLGGTGVSGAGYKGFSRNAAGTVTTIMVSGSTQTLVTGVSDDGSKLVGSFLTTTVPRRGFIRVGGVDTILSAPGHKSTDIQGISGDGVLGSWTDNVVPTSFVYSITKGTYTDLTGFPGLAAGIYGNTIVGSYGDSLGSHGFIGDITKNTWTKFDMPGTNNVTLAGVYAGIYVGNWTNQTTGAVHGLLVYDGNKTLTIDRPGATQTYPMGIFGSTVVGYDVASDGSTHGFQLTLTGVPEPASLGLLAGASLLFLRRPGYRKAA